MTNNRSSQQAPPEARVVLDLRGTEEQVSPESPVHQIDPQSTTRQVLDVENPNQASINPDGTERVIINPAGTERVTINPVNNSGAALMTLDN